jgi:arylsulfatase A-like enzyme
MPRLRIFCLVALALLLASTVHAQEKILILVADNVGPELIGAYGGGNSAAPTPNLDALAASGVLFRNVTSNPYGGPTRATLLTGRYGFRTDVGALKPPTQPPHFTTLDADEITLPEMLTAAGTGYRSAALGEWNIGPLPQGFEYYAGVPDVLSNYKQFTKTRYFADGSSDQVLVSCDSTNTDPVVAGHSAGRAEPCYETTNLVDEAILKIQEFETAQSPWLVWVAFHAAHSPFHQPPADLLPSGRRYNWKKDSDKLRAMVEAMDTEIGRLLASLPADTTVVFVSDNNGENASGGCTPTLGSCIHVPLIVRRPGSAQGESAAVVNTTDLFATVAGIAGVTSAAEDSVSLLPYLANPGLATQTRPSAGGPYAYGEYFYLGLGSFGRAIRDDRYKYVWTYSGGSGPAEALYDLAADPQELTNLLDLDGDGVPNPPQPGAEQAAHDALARAIFETLLDPDRDLIPYQEDNCPTVPNRLEGNCDTDGDGIGNACDCDFDNDGLCNFADFSILSQQLNTVPPTDLNPDMNCDGDVDADDFDTWQTMYGQQPGPSGLYCADPTGTTGTCQAPIIPDSGVDVRENILMIVIDDVGRELLPPYGGTNPVPAPSIQSLADAGLLFQTAYAHPTCSPTRASILTGRYASRVGIGTADAWLTRTDVPTLPRALADSYRTAGIGKLHLSGQIKHSIIDITNPTILLQVRHPVDLVGFETFKGMISNFGQDNFGHPYADYYNWYRYEVSATATGATQEHIACSGGPNDPNYQSCYITSVTVNDAIEKIDEFKAAGQPWFMWVGFNAAHTPLHTPPPALVPSGETDQLRAMVEALDQEIGRLIDHVDQVAPRTTVILVGDNGALKGSMSEGGVRVPFVIRRRGMPFAGSVSSALVNTTDLYDTVLDIAEVPGDAPDSESLVPLLEDPVTPPGQHTLYRTAAQGPFIYSDKFPQGVEARAIRSQRFKYTWLNSGAQEGLFDFDGAGEALNLLDLDGDGVPNPPPDPVSQTAYDDLKAAIVQIQDADGDGVDYRFDNCVEVANGGSLACDVDGDNIGNACDCDFDNDGRCDSSDLQILTDNLSFVGTHVADMNCDGQVDTLDESLFIPMQGGKPGPTGISGAGPGSVTCGNGALEVWEACDGSDFGTLTCGSFGCTGGTLTCSATCRVNQWSCTGCGTCGDQVLDPGEECDGSDFGALTCADFGCAAGTLRCTAGCVIDSESFCTECSACNNNGLCEAGEDCSNCPADCISGSSSAACGNGSCDAWAGETCLSCPQDCNGKQNGPAGGRFCCGDSSQGATIPCSDSRCTSSGFSCSDAQVSYCCGDATCEGIEDSSNCELDCGPPPVGGCGDGVCAAGEDCATCAADCEGKTTGPASKQFCCGNGTPEGPEGDGSRCDGNY